jgi:predicted house-cleaning noncanonical NTP pyrophosphatase (MazG superfamily)
MEIIYNKLVRDRIAEIIKKSGKKYEVEIVDNAEYKLLLNKKLLEEVNEYLETENIEEIADILEVLYSIMKYENIDKEEIERIRMKKNQERGSFEKRIKLIKVID